MIEKATDPQLKQGFQTHLGETKDHVQRLEQVFKMHGVEVKGVDCPAIDGIIDEAEEVAGEVEDKRCSMRADRCRAGGRALRDHALRDADRMGEAARPQRLRDVLQQNLNEEKAADKKLTDLAESKLNSESRELTICIEEEKSRQRAGSFFARAA